MLETSTESSRTRRVRVHWCATACDERHRKPFSARTVSCFQAKPASRVASARPSKSNQAGAFHDHILLTTILIAIADVDTIEDFASVTKEKEIPKLSQQGFCIV